MTVGQRIRKLMQDKGITQKQLGDELGYCDKTICNWVRDRNEPNISSLCYMADRFGVSVDYLVGHKTKK